MLYAKNGNDKIRATPGTLGTCPLCDEVMIPKCGEINIWHWAHKNLGDCDHWYESETNWHLQWKEYFPRGWTEVALTKGDEKHIADIMCPNGLVLEFQHSPISPSEIEIREAFYGNMVWVFDIQDCLVGRFNIRTKKNYWTFRWKYPRKHIAYANRDVYLDIGNDRVFQLKKFYPETPAGGWGYIVQRGEFIDAMAMRGALR